MKRLALPIIILVLFGVTLVILSLYTPGTVPYDPTWSILSLVAGLILIGMAVCLLRSGK